MIYIYAPGSGGFEWDAHNVAHIARHGLLPAEVEHALSGELATLLEEFVERGERRSLSVGPTGTGRLIVVVWTSRGARVRVVTAYPANRRVRRDYERAKGVGNDSAPGTDSRLQDGG
jgi:uncharacterized DUF497 family protein